MVRPATSLAIHPTAIEPAVSTVGPRKGPMIGVFPANFPAVFPTDLPQSLAAVANEANPTPPLAMPYAKAFFSTARIISSWSGAKFLASSSFHWLSTERNSAACSSSIKPSFRAFSIPWPIRLGSKYVSPPKVLYGASFALNKAGCKRLMFAIFRSIASSGMYSRCSNIPPSNAPYAIASTTAFKLSIAHSRS